MSTYEPGTVAVATVRGEPNVRVFIDDSKNCPVTSGIQVDGNNLHGFAQVTDIRPLVVLDLDYIRFERYGMPQILQFMRADHRLAPMADQIEAQTKPPRIPEPGLWGVIYEPSGFDWMRVGPTQTSSMEWQCCENAARADWESFINPVLVRPGIEDES